MLRKRKSTHSFSMFLSPNPHPARAAWCSVKSMVLECGRTEYVKWHSSILPVPGTCHTWPLLRVYALDNASIGIWYVLPYNFCSLDSFADFCLNIPSSWTSYRSACLKEAAHILLAYPVNSDCLHNKIGEILENT